MDQAPGSIGCRGIGLRAPKVYINDDWQDDRLLTHSDLVRNWEKALRFIIANHDEPPIV